MENFKFYEVGGKIRDELLGLTSKDVDYVAVPRGCMLDAGCSNANKTFTLLYTAEDMFSKLEAFLKKEKFEIFLVTPDCYTIRAKFPEGYKYQGVAASMATYSFNRKFSEIVHEKCWNRAVEPDELISAYKRAIKSGALFDARCFNIPKEEVTNCILWRQQDATRNSISSAGQAHFSHKQLEGLNSNQIQELLFQEKGINWNDYLTKFKRGSCCIKKHHQTLRSHWTIDNEIPIFKGEGREYIEKLIV